MHLESISYIECQGMLENSLLEISTISEIQVAPT